MKGRELTYDCTGLYSNMYCMNKQFAKNNESRKEITMMQDVQSLARGRKEDKSRHGSQKMARASRFVSLLIRGKGREERDGRKKTYNWVGLNNNMYCKNKQLTAHNMSRKQQTLMQRDHSFNG